jgi:hypothetical protein
MALRVLEGKPLAAKMRPLTLIQRSTSLIGQAFHE